MPWLWGKREERGKRHESLGPTEGLKPPEPNTRLQALPLRAHTTTQVNTHNAHKTLWRQHRRVSGQGSIDRKRNLKLSRYSQQRDSLRLWPPRVPQMSPKSGLLSTTPKSLPRTFGLCSKPQ